MSKVNYFMRLYKFRQCDSYGNDFFKKSMEVQLNSIPKTKCQWDISRSYEFIRISHQFTKMI